MKLRSANIRSDFFRRGVFVALGLLGIIVLAGSLSGQLLRVQTTTPQQITVAQGQLNSAALSPGPHSITFEGKDAAGNPINLSQTFTVPATISPTAGSSNIAVLYTSGAGSPLTLARWRDGQWLKETLPFGGLFASLAVDSQGHFHISYATTRMMYATNASGAWVSEVINPQVVQYGYAQNEIFVDAAGQIEVFYRDIYNRTFSATKVSGQWQNTSATSWKSKDTYQRDSQGNLHELTINRAVGFNQATLSYTTTKNSNLTSTILFQEDRAANCFPYGVGVAQAIDSTGRAHIVYPRGQQCLGGEETWYATESPNGIEQMAIPGAAGNYPARKITVDGQGNPYIAVVQNGSYIWQPRRVTVFSRSGAGWQSYDLESNLVGSQTYRIEGMVNFE